MSRKETQTCEIPKIRERHRGMAGFVCLCRLGLRLYPSAALIGDSNSGFPKVRGCALEGSRYRKAFKSKTIVGCPRHSLRGAAHDGCPHYPSIRVA